MRKARSKQWGPDHPSTLITLNDLALAYQNAGKLTQAIELFEQVRDAEAKTSGANDHNTLITLANLAGAYRQAGKLTQATELYEQVRDAAVKKLGADHPSTLFILNSLAAAYLVAGKLTQAIELLERVRDAQLRKLGAGHPETLATMCNLALAYQAAGKLDLALPLYEETLKLQKEKYGADHPSTLVALNNLAIAYRAAGKLPPAIELLEQVRDASVKKQGADHPSTLLSLNNLGMAYKAAGKLTQALPLLEQAAAGIEKRNFLSECAATVIPNTIAAYEAAGQFGKAEAWRRKWLAVEKKKEGVVSAAYAGELAALGVDLLNQKKYADAEPVLRECLELHDKLLEKKQAARWQVANVKSMLGEALLGQKKLAEAEPLVIVGYEGLKQNEDAIPEATRYVRRIEGVQRLIDLARATNKPDDLKKWQAEFAKYPPSDPAKAQGHQAAWAKNLGVPVEITNSIGMRLVLIPPGEFEMGSPKERIEEELKAHSGEYWYKGHVQDEGPKHRVRITRPFYLGVYAVTQGEYQRVMGANPSEFSSAGKEKDKVAGQDTTRFPVEHVSWDDTVEFCRKLSQLPEEKAAGQTYRLPSEAQWEYACRAENAGRWCFSAQPNPCPVAFEMTLLRDYAWFDHAGGTTHAVGGKRPNAWGLYDMYGNVWEWCQDWYGQEYYSKSATDDPAGPPSGSNCVLRGAGWDRTPYECRSCYRGSSEPSNRSNNIGFRVCLVPGEKTVTPAELLRLVDADGKWSIPSNAPPPAVAPFGTAKAQGHQSAWAKHLGVPVEITNSIGMRLVLIPPGEFQMGSPEELIQEQLHVHEENDWYRGWYRQWLSRRRAGAPGADHKTVLARCDGSNAGRLPARYGPQSQLFPRGLETAGGTGIVGRRSGVLPAAFGAARGSSG